MKTIDASKLTQFAHFVLTQEQLDKYFGVSVEQDDGMALFWLEAGADVNSRFKGEPVLLHAIWNENEDLVNKLVEFGADVNALDSDQDPILFQLLDNVKWLNILAKGKLDINVKRWDGENALSIAYRKNKEDVIDRLIELGINVDESIIGGSPILIGCFQWNNGRGLDKLLSLKLDVNKRDEHGNSALIWAVKKNDEYAVDRLIEAKADVNLKGWGGSTALMFVRKYTIAEKLIKSGAKLGILNMHNENAISECLKKYAEESDYHTKEMENICELLIKSDEEHNVCERDRLLSLASKGKSKKLVKLIKEVYKERKYTYIFKEP